MAPQMTATDPERVLALSYAPLAARVGLEALFALDATLAAIVRTTREPIVGQMRLTWWYETLGKLDSAPPPAEPVLQALFASVIPAGVSGSELALMTEGWEALLASDLDAAAIDRFGIDRGGRLFSAAAAVLNVQDPRIARAGQGWALADLSDRLTDTAARELARSSAVTLLDAALRGRWPARARALGAMALSARSNIATTPTRQASPKRVGRLLLHRLTGY